MEVMIIKDTAAEALEEKANKEIEKLEKTGVVENIKAQYQTSVIPQIRGDKIQGYKVEYSVLITFQVMKLLRDA